MKNIETQQVNLKVFERDTLSTGKGVRREEKDSARQSNVNPKPPDPRKNDPRYHLDL